MAIADVLRYNRKHRGWTLRDLSKRAKGLSISFLSDIERGRSIPSIETVMTLAGAFDMQMSEFMGEAQRDLTIDEQRLLEAYRAGDVHRLLRMTLEVMERQS